MSGTLNNPVVQHRHEFAIFNGSDEAVATLTVQRSNGVLFVQNVWVHQDYRNQGLVSRLFERALAEVSHEDLYLHAQAYADMPRSDAQLGDYYRRFGFTPVDAFPGGMVRRSR